MANQVTDTIIANQQIVDAICDDMSHDYDRQFGTSASSSVFDGAVNSSTQHHTVFDWESQWWIAILLLLVFIAVIVYFGNKGWFKRSKKEEEDVVEDVPVVEDDINVIDFVTDIDQAVNAGNYREACRLYYLKTLKELSDNAVIDWALYKTPNEYVREVRDNEFTELTNHFLRVRYGDFEATPALYELMKKISASVRERIVVPVVTRKEVNGETE